MLLFTLLAVYLLLLAAITWRSYRMSGTTEDYLVANRDLGVLGVASSATVGVLDSTAVLIMFGSVLLFGAGGIGIWVGYLGATVLIALLAPRFYDTVSKQNILTLSEFFKARFGPRTEQLFVAISTLFSIGLIVGIYSINLTLFEHFLGFGVITATATSLVITVSYVLVGGFRALIKTDILQFVIMLACLLAAVFWFPSTERIPFGEPSIWFTGAFLAIGPVIFFQNMMKPAAWQPILGARNRHVASQGMWLAVLFNLLIILPIVWVSFSYAWLLPDSAPTNVLLDALATALPNFLTPVVFIALFAALMSSLDSILFFVGSNLIHHCYRSTWKTYSERFLIRGTIVLVSSVTALVAILVPDFVSFAFAIVPLIGIMAIPFLAAIFRPYPECDTTVVQSGLLAVIVFGYLFINPPDSYLWNLLPILLCGGIFLFKAALTKQKRPA